MENPATWGQAEKVINSVLQGIFTRDRSIVARDRDEAVCGLSHARLIADALRDADLLKEDDGR